MDSHPPKSNTRPAGRQTDGTEPTDRANAFPISSAPRIDGFLDPPERPDEIGRFGPYRVLSILGRGGMGAVYRAEDTRLNRELAIKVLLPGLAADPRAKARFVREAQAQAKVEHDHIVAIHQIGEANGVPFIAMPLLKGQTLADALKQNPRPPAAEVVRVGREIAEGLVAAHAAGLIHRDIKPSNVWLESPKRRVKILDFGLARGSDPVAGSDSEPITAAGAIMGTPAYMSPEQARSQPVDVRSDLFSLGAVLYQMATGKMPFTGASAFDVMAAAVSKEPPPVLAAAPEVPPEVGNLIHRLLAKNPAERPPSAEAVADELEALQRGLPLTLRVTPLPADAGVSSPSDPWVEVEATDAESLDSGTHATGPPTRRWLWVAGAGLALLVLVVVVVQVVNRKPKEVVEGQQPPPGQQKPPPDVAPMPRDPRPFFNGKDLDGWEGLPENWQVRDGAIVGTLLPGQGGTFLCGTRSYTDFELTFQVKLVSSRGNSGVQIRSRVAQRDTFQVAGPQCDIGTGHWGALYDQANAAFIKKAPPEIERSIQTDRYIEYAIRCVGNRVTIKINGKTSIDEEFPIPDEGILAWQVNAIAGPRTLPIEVIFRNIRFTDLRK